MERTVVGGCNSNINVDGHYHEPIGSFFYGLTRTADATAVVSPAHPPSLTSRSAAHAAISQKNPPRKGERRGKAWCSVVQRILPKPHQAARYWQAISTPLARQ